MANWPYESIKEGYTIVNGSISGTAASKVSCWLEYKIISQSVAVCRQQHVYHPVLYVSCDLRKYVAV
jgi:hypothetical protein